MYEVGENVSVSKFEDRVSELERERHQLLEDIDSLNEQIAQLRGELQSAQDDCWDLREQLEGSSS